jgi:hypothetical protein
MRETQLIVVISPPAHTWWEAIRRGVETGCIVRNIRFVGIEAAVRKRFRRGLVWLCGPWRRLTNIRPSSGWDCWA